MSSLSPSRTDQRIAVALCIFLFAYGLHGFLDGVFYLPVRRGPALTVEGAYTLVPFVACWLVAASLLVRVHVLIPQLRVRRTAVELLLLVSGVSLWVFSFSLATCCR